MTTTEKTGAKARTREITAEETVRQTTESTRSVRARPAYNSDTDEVEVPAPRGGQSAGNTTSDPSSSHVASSDVPAEPVAATVNHPPTSTVNRPTSSSPNLAAGTSPEHLPSIASASVPPMITEKIIDQTLASPYIDPATPRTTETNRSQLSAASPTTSSPVPPEMTSVKRTYRDVANASRHLVFKDTRGDERGSASKPGGSFGRDSGGFALGISGKTGDGERGNGRGAKVGGGSRQGLEASLGEELESDRATTDNTTLETSGSMGRLATTARPSSQSGERIQGDSGSSVSTDTNLGDAKILMLLHLGGLTTTNIDDLGKLGVILAEACNGPVEPTRFEQTPSPAHTTIGRDVLRDRIFDIHRASLSGRGLTAEDDEAFRANYANRRNQPELVFMQMPSRASAEALLDRLHTPCGDLMPPAVTKTARFGSEMDLPVLWLSSELSSIAPTRTVAEGLNINKRISLALTDLQDLPPNDTFPETLFSHPLVQAMLGHPPPPKHVLQGLQRKRNLLQEAKYVILLSEMYLNISPCWRAWMSEIVESDAAVAKLAAKRFVIWSTWWQSYAISVFDSFRMAFRLAAPAKAARTNPLVYSNPLEPPHTVTFQINVREVFEWIFDSLPVWRMMITDLEPLLHRTIMVTRNGVAEVVQVAQLVLHNCETDSKKMDPAHRAYPTLVNTPRGHGLQARGMPYERRLLELKHNVDVV